MPAAEARVLVDDLRFVEAFAFDFDLDLTLALDVRRVLALGFDFAFDFVLGLVRTRAFDLVLSFVRLFAFDLVFGLVFDLDLGLVTGLLFVEVFLREDFTFKPRRLDFPALGPLRRADFLFFVGICVLERTLERQLARVMKPFGIWTASCEAEFRKNALRPRGRGAPVG